MRNFKELVIDLAKKPPILFPLVGLFHLVWLVVTVSGLGAGISLLDVLWFAGYTTFWLAACDMRRWGALGYILLTLLNTALYLAVRNGKLPEHYMSSMFLLDGIFSFFLLFYYKRFH